VSGKKVEIWTIEVNQIDEKCFCIKARHYNKDAVINLKKLITLVSFS
jgi:hypothetical protein